MRIISISMAKGGVGKSVTAVNLGAALAKAGNRTVLIDIDPQQGNATLALGHTPSALKITIANVISSFMDLGQVDGLDRAILSVGENFDLLPANPKLEAVQTRMIAERSNSGLLGDDASIPCHEILKNVLAPLKDSYDYTVIDCPPSISMLTINALVASDSVILPMEAHYECYEALKQMLDVVSRIRANWNPRLAIEGILMTKYQSRTNLCRDVSKYTEENYGGKMKIFPDVIPFSIKAAELSSIGTDIFTHQPKSDVANSYSKLAEEVMSSVR